MNGYICPTFRLAEKTFLMKWLKITYDSSIDFAQYSLLITNGRPTWGLQSIVMAISVLQYF